MFEVFLLSIDEAMEYFSDEVDRMCKVTDYAITKGCYVKLHDKGRWWLRSPGYHNNLCNAYVSTYGGIHDSGTYVSHDDFGIRPVMVTQLYD